MLVSDCNINNRVLAIFKEMGEVVSNHIPKYCGFFIEPSTVCHCEGFYIVLNA